MWQLIVVAFLGFGVYAYWKTIFRQETFLEGLCYHMGTGRYESRRLGRGFRSYSFSGRSLGRQYAIVYRYRPRGLQFRVSGELEIQIPLLQKFWLRVLPKQNDVDPPDSVIVDDDLIDALYSVHCNQSEAAKKFLKSSEAQVAFRGFRHPFSKLEIYRGWFKILYSQPVVDGFVPGDVEYALDLFVPMIAAYEEQGVLVRAAVPVIVSDEICPYCRGDLDPVKDSVVTCAECRTRLHESCWKENGQCTTWGCKSVTPTHVGNHGVTEARREY